MACAMICHKINHHSLSPSLLTQGFYQLNRNIVSHLFGSLCLYTSAGVSSNQIVAYFRSSCLLAWCPVSHTNFQGDSIEKAIAVKHIKRFLPLQLLTSLAWKSQSAAASSAVHVSPCLALLLADFKRTSWWMKCPVPWRWKTKQSCLGIASYSLHF